MSSNNINLINDNCLHALSRLPAGSVDLVLTDLPYGTTACPWDSVLPLDALWKEFYRVAKTRAAFVLTAQQPFTWVLCASNPRDFKYELIWEKPNGTNPFHARLMPMKKHENILVFYRAKPTYNPQMVEGRPYRWNSSRSKGDAGGIRQLKSTPIENTGTRYPGSVLRMAQDRGLHPTQKPVELMEWLVRTYSNPGDLVLDATMGSGTTGVAAIRSGRRFCGIELDAAYFENARTRILAAACDYAAQGMAA